MNKGITIKELREMLNQHIDNLNYISLYFDINIDAVNNIDFDNPYLTSSEIVKTMDELNKCSNSIIQNINNIRKG